MRLSEHQEWNLLEAHYSHNGRTYARTQTGRKLVALGLARWVSYSSIATTEKGSEYCDELMKTDRWADSQFAPFAKQADEPVAINRPGPEPAEGFAIPKEVA